MHRSRWSTEQLCVFSERLCAEMEEGAMADPAQAAATLLPLSPQALLVSLVLLVVLLLLLVPYYFATSSIRSVWFWLSRGHVDDRLLPPSPPRLPVIGHLHLVGSDPTVSLAGLDKRYGAGGLMMLYLGQVRNLVVSSPCAAEAVLRTHDQIFASRPPSAVGDVLFCGSLDVGLAPYGEYWRQVRKLVTTHLLSAMKVRSFRRAREEEARLVLARVREAAGAAVDLSELLSSFTNDIVCRAVSGKFFREEGRNKIFWELIETTMVVSGGFNLEDHFPSLAKIDVLMRVLLVKISKVKKRWDGLLDKIIDEHVRHDGDDHEQDQDQERDFVDILLSLQHEYSLGREHIKAILVDMFVAGTDTSYIVLEYAMAELMRKPDAMTKLKDEVRRKTPKDQQMVKEDDLSSMNYLKAVIKETLRLHPPVPLLIPRISITNCNDIDGYMVPAGTRVMVNVWALGRDTRTWGENAGEFVPERFMDDTAVDFKGTHFGFLPFGGGRRMCPGMNFGMASVDVMLANLVYCFDWELPSGMRREDVDMTCVFGLTVRRKEKLSLVPIPHDQFS